MSIADLEVGQWPQYTLAVIQIDRRIGEQQHGFRFYLQTQAVISLGIA